MLPRGEIWKNLLATLEIALFMRQGPARFGHSFDEMLRSWLIIFITMPVGFVCVAFMAPTNPVLADLPVTLNCFLFFVQALVSTGLAFLVIWMFTRQYKKTEYFLTTITALNWIGVIPTLLYFPLVIGLVSGHLTWDETRVVTIFFAFYGLLYTAFTITHVMRIPWQMGGFLTIVAFAINETTLDAMYWTAEKL